MESIYNESLISYLKDNLGSEPKITSKNIVIPCPYCEYNKSTKDHYHCYISLELPIFNCFHCPEKGSLKKLLKKISGSDVSDKFVDKSKIVKTLDPVFNIINKQKIKLPKINTDLYFNKTLYLRKRFRFANIDINNVKGLVFDIDKFIDMNNITINSTLFKIRDYLQTNFIGFLTEHSSILILRNIDSASSFRYFKIKIQDVDFLDYYKLNGGSYKSKQIVLSEGIFDLYDEQIFNRLNLKNNTKLYACSLSSKYLQLIKSIVFYEQLFRPDIIILSDRMDSLNMYKNMKKYNSHIINKLTVYFNRSGKDFNSSVVDPEKRII
jgi:hypothetical protein